MFDPRLIRPDRLGLVWDGMIDECRARISPAIVEVVPAIAAAAAWESLRIALPEPVGIDRIYLNFEHHRLVTMNVSLFESRDFWEPDWEIEEMEEIDEAYFGYFVEAERHLSELLGPPAFRGDSETKGMDEARISTGEEVAYWIDGDTRIQLEFGHEDKELPFSVDLFLVPHRAV